MLSIKPKDGRSADSVMLDNFDFTTACGFKILYKLDDFLFGQLRFCAKLNALGNCFFSSFAGTFPDCAFDDLGEDCSHLVEMVRCVKSGN